MLVMEEALRNPRSADHPHLTVIGEAHRLLPEKGAVELTGMVRQVGSCGEGVVFVEQAPDRLLSQVTTSTALKVMHRLEDKLSRDLLCSLLNLNQQQREYVCTLAPGFAILHGLDGRPAHVRVVESEYEGSEERTQDAAVRAWMAEKRRSLVDEPVN